MNRREVVFDYQKLEVRRKEQRRVQPYHVGQLQNGWYLIAHDLARQEMRKFALQRMSGLEVLRSRFQRDPTFNMREYLSSGFGVWSYSCCGAIKQGRLVALKEGRRRGAPCEPAQRCEPPGAGTQDTALLESNRSGVAVQG